MPTTISNELSKIIKLRYLESMSRSELAYWLINSFSPERYRDPDDVIEQACGLMYKKISGDLAAEFIERLWGMFGMLPDHEPIIENGVINYLRVVR